MAETGKEDPSLQADLVKKRGCVSPVEDLVFQRAGEAEGETKIEPVTVTVNNVTKLEPVVLYVSLAKLYDPVRLPQEVTNTDDMQNISKLISFCANSKSYLNSLSVYLDIATRLAKRKGKEGKQIYDDMICRKNIVNSYADMIDNLSKAGSRMVTIYLEAKKANEEDGFSK